VRRLRPLHPMAPTPQRRIQIRRRIRPMGLLRTASPRPTTPLTLPKTPRNRAAAQWTTTSDPPRPRRTRQPELQPTEKATPRVAQDSEQDDDPLRASKNRDLSDQQLSRPRARTFTVPDTSHDVD